MYSVRNLWNASPARIVAVVMAIIAVLATYGLNVVHDADKFATALFAVLGLLSGGEIVRSQVYSPNTVAAIRASTIRSATDDQGTPQSPQS